MGLPHDNSTPCLKRKRLSVVPLSADGSSSSSPFSGTGQLVGDAETPLGKEDDATERSYALKESLTRSDASVALPAEGRPPTNYKWNFNFDTLPSVSSELEILKWLPSNEPEAISEALFRGMEKCIKRHRQQSMVG